MISIRRKFMSLLSLEMESLHDELKLILETLDRRLANHEITEYVRNENYATLMNEIIGLEHCMRRAPEFSSDEDAGLDEIAEQAKRCLKARFSECGYVDALYALVSGRIDKICSYLRLDAPTRAGTSA